MAERTENGLPRVLAIAWGMEVAPARGPRRELSHEAIVDAAIELADAQGLAGVTMAKVAEALGFTTMSLYRYVTSKDELIALMQDAVAREPAVLAVDAEDWRAGLSDFAAALHAVYATHPWMLDIPMSPVFVLMPNNMRFADAAYRAMRTLSVAPQVKQAALLCVTMLARVFGQFQRDLVRAAPDAGLEAEGLSALLEVVTRERFPDLAPVLASGGYTEDPSEEGNPLDDFALGLQLLLDGLAAQVHTHPAGPTSTTVAGAPSALDRAEHDLQAVTAQRKAAQARVKELEKGEREAQRTRDRARKG